MLLTDERSVVPDEKHFNAAVHEIYRYVIEIGGVISGEHGVGLLQKEFMELQYPAPAINLMKGIKNIFDPNGILNPGKMIG
jgi:glycolate oxidase